MRGFRSNISFIQKTYILISKDKKLLSIYRDIEIKLMRIITEMEHIGVSD